MNLKVRLQRAAWRSHRGAGLVLGAWFALTGLSGGLLVYADVVDAVAHPGIVPGPCTARPPLGELVAALERDLPALRPAVWNLPTEAQSADRAYLRDPDGSTWIAFIDACRARVLNLRSTESVATEWLLRLHTQLLAGRAGELLVLLLGGLLVLQLVAGWHMYRGWGRLWRRGIRPGSAAGRAAADLHKLLGSSCLLPLLLIGTIGIYLSCLSVVSSGETAANEPAGRPAARIAPATVTALLSDAAARVPRLVVHQVRWPVAPGEAFVVKGRQADAGVLRSEHSIVLRYGPDPRSMLSLERAADRPWHGQLADALLPLHTGSFAGSWSRAAYVAVACCLPCLWGSALYAWARRRSVRHAAGAASHT